MQALFLALSILLAINFNKSGNKIYLYAMSFFFALGLGNHLSIILLAPGLAVIVLSHNNFKDIAKHIPISLLLACLGLSIYLYLPIRYSAGPALDYAQSYWKINLTTFDGFIWMLSGNMFNSLFWAYGIKDIPHELLKYFHQLWSNYLGLGVILGLIGLIFTSKSYPKLNIGFGIMLVGYLFFYIPYGAVDKEVMFLPSYFIWCIWIGMGVLALNNFIKNKYPSYEMFATNILIFLAIGGLMVNFSYVDISQDLSAREYGEKIISSLELDSLYFGSWIDIPILEYLQIVEGKRSDITTRNLVFMSPEDSTKLAKENLLSGKSVYTSSSFWFDDSDFFYLPISSCSCFELQLKQEYWQ
jgi:hypothetical protein